MTSWNPEYLKDIFDRVDENVQIMRDAVDSTIPGTPLGATPASEQEIAALVAQLQAANPNYIRALPYVDGGMALLSAYERVNGLRP